MPASTNHRFWDPATMTMIFRSCIGPFRIKITLLSMCSDENWVQWAVAQGHVDETGGGRKADQSAQHKIMTGGAGTCTVMVVGFMWQAGCTPHQIKWLVHLIWGGWLEWWEDDCQKGEESVPYSYSSSKWGKGSRNSQSRKTSEFACCHWSWRADTWY